MKKVLVMSAILAIVLAGCNSNRVDVSKLKPVTTHKVGDLSVVLMNDTGDFKQGRTNSSSSSRIHRGRRSMSGDSEITPTSQTGTYRVKSKFGMSGAWHFTVAWNGAHGQGKTAFNSNVR